MAQEYNINNFELYRLEDITPVGGLTYYSNAVTTMFRYVNGFNFIIDNPILSNNSSRIRKFDKSWNLITTYTTTGIGTGNIYEIIFVNGFYYTISYGVYPYVTKFDEDFNQISQYLITPNVELRSIVFYKNYYFIFCNTPPSNAPVSILRYDADTDQSFTLNNKKTFTNVTDFGGELDDTIFMGMRETYLNYNTGEIIINSRKSSNTIQYINIFNLDNLINEVSYNSNKPYLSKTLKSNLNEIPYCIFSGMTIYDGHYILYESNPNPPSLGNMYINKIHIYDFEWNKISEFKTNIINNIYFTQNNSDTIVSFNNYSPGTNQSVKIYKIK